MLRPGVILGFLALAAGPAQAQVFGDAGRGAAAFEDCAVCHEIGPDAATKVGPPLNGLFGRRAASVEGFGYSDGLTREGRDGLVWTLRTLDAYIANPKALVSKTNMDYPGMSDAGKRSDLLAYLRQFSDAPSDLPEAAPTATARAATSPVPVGDPAWGEYLSSQCTSCHQADGGDDGIPAITGWTRADFAVAMRAYRDKVRPHPVMQMIAGRLSDEEIAALAAYYAAL